MASAGAFPLTFVDAFRGKRSILVDKIDVSHGLLNELLDREVLTHQQVSHCRSLVSEHERANKMLDLLERRDDSLFPSFCEALVACDQGHIVSTFFQPTPNASSSATAVNNLPPHGALASVAAALAAQVGRRQTKELARFRQSGIVKLDANMLPAEVTRVPYSQLTDLEPMAEGGFGIVYRAKHKDWGVVAYKQLKSTIIKETDKIGRDLIKEAQMHVLRHPNIVAMLGVTFEVGHYGVLFEYVAYGGLDGFIETYSVDWLMKLTIANGIVRGLNYIHTKNPPVVHGDLKAQNILVDDGYVPKICDFGLSKWRTFSTTKTDSRSLRGTVTHIPPENWQNINQRRTTKYDVYGFGVLLWELLSEQAPFPNAAANVAQIEAAVVAGQRPDLEELKREDGEDGVKVPEEDFQFARDTITMCWDQDPNKRPPFAELNSRFEDFLKQREDGIKKALDRLNKAVAESLENEEAGDEN